MRTPQKLALLALVPSAAIASTVPYSNFSSFVSAPGFGTSSSVNAGNAPQILGAQSMRVVFDDDVSVREVRALTSRQAIADTSVLSVIRVSIYASAADVVARNTFLSTDFTTAQFASTLWTENETTFHQLSFDLGATVDLDAGEWFFELATVDAATLQYFLAYDPFGDGRHALSTTGAFGPQVGSFALELRGDEGTVIPLPTGGAMGLAGLALLGARRRR